MLILVNDIGTVDTRSNDQGTTLGLMTFAVKITAGEGRRASDLICWLGFWAWRPSRFLGCHTSENSHCVPYDQRKYNNHLILGAKEQALSNKNCFQDV